MTRAIPNRVRRTPGAGLFLIADPFLADPEFGRSIIFLVAHDEAGSIGFILNRPGNTLAGAVFHGLPETHPVMHGGPVGKDHLFYIHTCPKVKEAMHIHNNLYWAGDPDHLQETLNMDILKPDELLVFHGYSGWGPGQLEAELEEKSWILAQLDDKMLFVPPDQMWDLCLRALGNPYRWMSLAPAHPQLN